MGKIRRGGFVFEWWIGDHEPRHILVSCIHGRVILATKEPMDAWQPPRRVIAIIEELQNEGRR
jgi:hypothetical protein